jgi:Yip1 domain
MLREDANKMIKTILLLIAPVRTWEDIFRARKSVGFVMVTFLLPMLLLGCFVEGFGLVRWGKLQGEFSHVLNFKPGEAVVFEALQFVALLTLVILNAGLLKSTCGTFQGRQTFDQGFRAIAYGMGPFLLLRCLDAFQSVTPWVSWLVGILLTWGVLYHGVPKIMDPDPAHAFGLYVVTCLLLFFTTGILTVLTALTLKGEFPKLMDFMSDLGARLPF